MTDEHTRRVGLAFQLEICVRRYYELFNERRLDEAERMVDPLAIFTYPGAGERFIGRAGYRELARRWLAAASDAHVAVDHVDIVGDRVAVDLSAGGTQDGWLELPGLEPVAPTRRAAHLRLRDLVTIRHGLIVDSRVDFNPGTLRRVFHH